MYKVDKSYLIGKIFDTAKDGSIQILQYQDTRNVTVKFIRTGHIRERVKLKDIQCGYVKDVELHQQELIYGVGYSSNGKHLCSFKNHIYNRWMNMLGRCYNRQMQEKLTSYVGCTVCDEWHDFQHFAEWYVSQVGNVSMEIDKDILIKGNRVYSPDTCLVVPREINSLFVRHLTDNRENGLPIGVIKDKRTSKYRATCKSKFFGQYTSCLVDTPKEAFYLYKSIKEYTIRMAAEKYRDRITDKAYQALINYKVEFND